MQSTYLEIRSWFLREEQLQVPFGCSVENIEVLLEAREETDGAGPIDAQVPDGCVDNVYHVAFVGVHGHEIWLGSICTCRI